MDQQLDFSSNGDETSVASHQRLTDAQFMAAYIASVFSSLLSLHGSFTIVYLVLRHKRWTEMYHRLVLGLSIVDILVTCDVLIQPFLLPAFTENKLAVGNQQTCTIVGFFSLYFVGSFIYNTELSLFFLMMVRYGMTEENISRRMEPHGHILPFLIPTVLGSIAILRQNINPNPYFGFCSVTPYPANCVGNDDIECTRGQDNGIVRGISHAFLLIVVLLGVISTWLIYWTMRHQFKRNRRYTFSSDSSAASGATDMETKKSRALGTQAILYTLSYMLYFFSVIISGIPLKFAPVLIWWTVFPLSGFLNCLIYVRQHLVLWKDAYPSKSWLWAYQQVLSGKRAPITDRTTHLDSNRAGHNACPESTIRDSRNDSGGRSALVNSDKMEAPLACNEGNKEKQLEDLALSTT